MFGKRVISGLVTIKEDVKTEALAMNGERDYRRHSREEIQTGDQQPL